MTKPRGDRGDHDHGGHDMGGHEREPGGDGRRDQQIGDERQRGQRDRRAHERLAGIPGPPTQAGGEADAEDGADTVICANPPSGIGSPPISRGDAGSMGADGHCRRRCRGSDAATVAGRQNAGPLAAL